MRVRQLQVLGIGVVALIGMVGVLRALPNQGPAAAEQPVQSVNGYDVATVSVGTHQVTVELAKTAEQQRRGLSGHARLIEEEGMLVIYNPPRVPSVWMKGIPFGIDILWIKAGRITEITANIPPVPAGTRDINLPVYQPQSAVDQALQMNAGWASRHDVQVGETVEVVERVE